jgi:hypothetical protein
MRLKVLLISDHYADDQRLGGPDLPNPYGTIVPSQSIPTPEAIALADYVFVVGPLGSEETAIALAGSIQLGIEAGTVAVYVYPASVPTHDQIFLERLGVPLRTAGIAFSKPTAVAEPFYRYISRFGNGGVTFEADEGEVLARHPSDGGAAAIYRRLGGGVLYVLPYQTTGEHADFVTDLFRAVEDHHEGVLDGVPEHLASFRLHGESDVLELIVQLEEKLAGVRGEADQLARFRMLVGPLQDQALEDLVIEALNAILEPTGCAAEDREDVGKEDFWIVNADGGDIALAEAKGIGSHVRNEHVNQVDNFRGDLERTAAELPGLLVVNIFRRSSDLEQKQLPVHPTVVATARRQNVLVLRGIDLYNLLSRSRESETTGAEFLTHLQGGGGWLEVGDNGLQLHTD